jgi:hypothetical protein
MSKDVVNTEFDPRGYRRTEREPTTVISKTIPNGEKVELAAVAFSTALLPGAGHAQ